MGLKKKVLVYLGLDDKEYNAKLKAATRTMDKAANTMSRDGRRLSIASRELFIGLTLPMGLLAKSVFDATGQMEKLTMGLETIGKSKGVENISQLVSETRELAKLPGLGLEETFQGVQSLLAVGLSDTNALKVVEGLGIGIARAGGNAESFGRVMRQLTQALAKGKLEMQDFKTIFEQMPEARGVLENAFGPGMADLEKLRTSGKSVADVMYALSDGFKDLGAEGFMDTIANQTENLSDAWLILRATVGEEIFKKSMGDAMGYVANQLDNITKYIKTMSPEAKELAIRFTKLAGAVAIIAPSMTFAAGVIKTLGSLLLKHSVIVRGIGEAFFFLGKSAASTGSAFALIPGVLGRVGIAVVSFTSIIKAAGAAFIRAIPLIFELYAAYQILGLVFPKLQKGIDNFVSSIANLPQHYKDIQRGMKQMGEEASILSILWEEWGNGMQATDTHKFAAELGKVNREFDENAAKTEEAAGATELMADAYKYTSSMVDNLTDSFGKVKKEIKEIPKLTEKALRNLGEYLRATTGIDVNSMGAPNSKGGDPYSHLDTQRLPQGQDRNNDFVTGILPSLSIPDIENAKASLIALQDIMLGRWINEEELARVEAFRDAIGNSFGAEVASGLSGIADTFGDFIGNVMENGPEAFKTFGESFKDAIRNMVVNLVKLIAKLAIAAALMAIIFPGAGGLSGAADAAGGSGFLKGLFGGLGVPGFADGGVVGGSSYHGDQLLARVNSGETILTAKQTKALATSGGGTIRLSGNFSIKGRDLVYIVEENQKQINGSR